MATADLVSFSLFRGQPWQASTKDDSNEVRLRRNPLSFAQNAGENYLP